MTSPVTATAPARLCETLPSGSWAGASVVIVGRGPSVASVRLDEINAAAVLGEVKVVVANNHHMDELPDATMRVSKHLSLTMDMHVLDPTALLAWPGHKVYVCANASYGVPDGVLFQFEQQRRPYRLGVWPRRLEDGIVTMGSSGIAALCIADCLLDGFGTIYLVGFDYQHGQHYGCDYGAMFRDRLELIRPYIRARCFVVGDSAMPEAWERGALPWA
jgi:hypothetical protein